ncbi:MAG: hypothetical protein M5U12_16635 [Verrucomicrobia bacterium]|nr:hypothetical protein [Verrucomicrobiota bacterium]
MLTWVQSWPLDVHTYTKSPRSSGELFEALWGNTPSSSIMS